MKREDRLYAALLEVAAAEHVNHTYLICGVCIARRALAEDDKKRHVKKASA